MRGFTKLFASITESSIWGEDDKTLRVWICFLARCDNEGIVEGSIPGLAHLCRMSIEDFKAAVNKLESPDPYSRTPDHEGRRVAPIQGGWRVLNYLSYRDKGQAKEGSRAPYMRSRRAAQKQGKTESNGQARTVTGCNALQLGVTRGTEERREKREALGEVSPKTPLASGDADGSKRFKPPTREELDLEAAKVGLPATEVTKFVAYYGSNGWKVGKAPMKSWQHALAGWAARWRERASQNCQPELGNRYGTSTGSNEKF